MLHGWQRRGRGLTCCGPVRCTHSRFVLGFTILPNPIRWAMQGIWYTPAHTHYVSSQCQQRTPPPSSPCISLHSHGQETGDDMMWFCSRTDAILESVWWVHLPSPSPHPCPFCTCFAVALLSVRPPPCCQLLAPLLPTFLAMVATRLSSRDII